MALPMSATLFLTICLWYGCFPMGVVMALGAYKWACHGIGSVPTGISLVLAACPLKGYFHKYDFFLKGGYLGWVGQHAMALVVCPQRLPWPLLLAYRGYLGLSCAS